ncbi:MAG: PilN domain-containing protein [Actinomycetota bacterium]|nr:PilN domain-containing protein [Actinomycetota bacterium]
MRAVNLIPRDDRRRRRTTVTERNNPVLVGGVAGAVVVTAILAAWFLTASTGVADNQKRRDAAQAELAATPVPPPTSPGASQLEQEKNARIAALSSALAGRLAWDRVLRELSLVTPDDVWMTSLSAQAPTAATSGTSTAGLTINGRTYSHDGVGRFLARLALVPHLSGVQLQHSSMATSETGRKVVEFAISATVKAAGSA